MPDTTRVGRRLRLPSPLFLPLVALLLVPLGLVACSDGKVSAPAVPTVTVEATPHAGNTAPALEDVVIELTSDGFTPDRIEIRAGTRVILRNATDTDLAVVVNGRESTDGNGITIRGGESVELDLQQLGAYVLTLSDDPLVTASVLIS